MNALTRTMTDLSGFLAKMAKDDRRIGDFLSEEPKYETACYLAKLNDAKPIAEAISSLDARIARETEKQSRRHWSFDGNRFIAFKQLRKALSEF